ncbi:glycosyltransferase [Mumia qirimensis]|uniref:glycosyltransferase n=1 Tax=Mumia qirimensis TaxID=3234852 RepID=UPI00351D887D
MRVLHVAPGDAIARIRPQLDAQREHGYDVRVACGRSSDRNWSKLEPFDPLDIPFPRRPDPRQIAKTLTALVRECRRWRTDYLHLHSPAVALTVRWVPRGLWPTGMRVVYTVHGYGHLWPPRGITARGVQQAERILAARTDLMLFQSREDLAESRARRYRSRLRYLGNGVEDAWFDMRPRPRVADRLEVVYVGRIVEEKGVRDLLAAVQGLDRVRLHLVGEAEPSDPAPVDLTEVSKGNGTPTLVHGRVEQPRLRELVGAADVLCLPSYREGVPQSVIEAMAAGRPAIVTDVRGCRELVTHERNGLVVPTRSPAALRAALRRMRDMPSDDYLAMCRAAKFSVESERRLGQVHARLLDAYQELAPAAAR